MLLKIDHPNIIRVRETNHKFTNIVIMEMELGSKNLEEYVDRKRKKNQELLKEEQVATIMQGVLNALHYLHDTKNIIHRDLKPENVLIVNKNDMTKIKLIDFGLAVKYTAAGVQDFAKCGTLLYTPPE